MRKAILKDKMLKLIIEDIYVTRAEQISGQLHVGSDIVLPLLKEMEESEHIKLVKVGSKGIDVIILKAPGRQFYKSSSYAQQNGTEDIEIESEDKPFKINRKILIWTIIAILAILVIVGINQGWFS
jgi:hypothetical protein